MSEYIFPLTEKEAEVLRRLAKNGPCSGYDFHLGGVRRRGQREALMTQAHWRKVKESLLKKGLIKLYSGRKAKAEDDRGRRKDLYWLTPDGAFVALGLDVEPDTLIAKIKEYDSQMEHFEEIKTLAEVVKVCGSPLGPQLIQALYLMVKENDFAMLGKIFNYLQDLYKKDKDRVKYILQFLSKHPTIGKLLYVIIRVFENVLDIEVLN